MSVSASPSVTTIAPITKTPSAQAWYRISTNRKKSTATQVRAVTNSYMLPQGARCTASPRVITAVVCAATPIEPSSTAAITQRPAARMARNAGTFSSGMEPATPPPPAGATGIPGAPGAPGSPGAAVPAAADPGTADPGTADPGTAPTVA